MAIEAVVRHYPTRWIILGPVLFASLLSAGLALLAVLGAPPWELSPGTAARPAGPPAVGQGSGPAAWSATPTPAAASPAAPLGAAPPGAAYRPGPATGHHTDGYQRSLLLSGMLGLAIAVVGLTMIGRRRQMW